MLYRFRRDLQYPVIPRARFAVFHVVHLGGWLDKAVLVKGTLGKSVR